MKRKFLAWISLLLAALTLLTSCAVGSVEGDSDTEQESVADSVESPASEPLRIIDNGHSDYKIVYSYDVSDEVHQKIKDTVTAIERKTGVKLTMKALSRGTTLDSDEKAILVGSTACAGFDKPLRRKDYIICASGNDLMITANEDGELVKALTYFYQKLLPAEYADGVFELPADYEYLRAAKYAYESATLLGENIGKFKIVVPKKATPFELYAAKTVWQHLTEYTGYELELVTDDTARTDREIVIGRTNRGSASVGTNEYHISAVQGSLYMVADGLYSYGTMADYATGTLFYSDTDEIKVDSIDSTHKNVSSELSRLQNEKFGEYRVLFNNILGNCDQELYPVARRNEMLSEIFKSYDADVIGLQECSANSRTYSSIIELLRTQGYEEVPVTGCSSNLYTPVLYKTSRLQLLDSGYLLFSLDAKKDGSKSLVWAVFKDNQSGEKFAVISAHFTVYGDDTHPVEQARVGNATELIETVEEIYKEYGCPTVIGGDLNCNTSSEAMKLLLSKSVHAREEAPITSDAKTSHTYPNYSEELDIYVEYWEPKANAANEAIDHICLFNTDKVSIDAFDVCRDKYACLSTDHCPVIVDFTINK